MRAVDMSDVIWIGVALLLVVPFFVYLGVWLLAWLHDIWNAFNGRESYLNEGVARHLGGSDHEPNATDPSDLG